MSDNKYTSFDTFEEAMKYVYDNRPRFINKNTGNELKSILKDVAPYAENTAAYVDIANKAAVTDILKPTSNFTECLDMFNTCIKRICRESLVDENVAMDILEGYRFLCGETGAQIMEQLIKEGRGITAGSKNAEAKQTHENYSAAQSTQQYKPAQTQPSKPAQPAVQPKPQPMQPAPAPKPPQTAQTKPAQTAQPQPAQSSSSSSNKDSIFGCLMLIAVIALCIIFPTFRALVICIVAVIAVIVIIAKIRDAALNAAGGCLENLAGCGCWIAIILAVLFFFFG